MKKLPWLKMRKKTDPELPMKPPIWFGNQSNGEYFRPATERDRKVERLVLERADENAKRLGMDRRDFLASAMGMCTTFVVLNEVACSSEEQSKGSPDAGGGARLCAIPETQYDESMACNAIDGDPDYPFIFDVQTHWFDEATASASYKGLFPSLFTNGTEDAYVEHFFCNSDTTVTAITAWPGNPCGPNVDPDNCGLPLGNIPMQDSRDRMNQMALNTRRSVNHVQVMGQSLSGVDFELETMEEMCARGGTAAWKVYPGYLNGFRMDDPAIGRRIIEKGLDLGVSQFCVHKGLQIFGFNKETNYPDDIGVVAADYPDANFVIYHSAIHAGYENNDAPDEGPYDPGPGAIGRPFGTNALIKALADNGIGPEDGQKPNKNVYGEVGSAINQFWRKDPSIAAHFFGKLMKYLGTDYVVWGTDCIVYGSPQPFIEWFRTVEIPPMMEEMYGYPPLNNSTPEGRSNKAKIFGLNAARLYGINVDETRCAITECPTALLKKHLDEEMGRRRWTFDEPSGPRTYREYLLHVERAAATGRPG